MYFGSVRFFKHLILVVLALMILTPVTVCIVLAAQNSGYRAQVEALTAQVRASEEQELVHDQALAPPTQNSSGQEGATEKETPGYQALYPEMVAPEAARSTVNQEKTAFLTFDDGPSEQTPKILEILDRYQVKATFFVIGKEDEQSKEWMRQIVDSGNSLGIHSYSHDYEKIYGSVEAYLEDFHQIYQLIYDTTGAYPQLFRFPGGSVNTYNSTIYREIISEMTRRGFVYYDWNVSGGDCAADMTVQSITETATTNLDFLRRVFVLFHDSAPKSETVEALPGVIEAYQNAGFTLEQLTPEVTPVVFGYQ